MVTSGKFTRQSQISWCDEPRGIGCWNLWVFMDVVSRKSHRNTGTGKRKKVLIEREFLESLTKLPWQHCRKVSLKLYLQTVSTAGTHLCKVFEGYCDFKRKLREFREVLVKEMNRENIARYKPRKRSAQCVSWTKTWYCVRTGLQGTWIEKSQDRKRIIINRRPKETITWWFSPGTFSWSCWLRVYLEMQISAKLCCLDLTIYNFIVITLQSTTCLTVMSCVTSGMRWTINWRTAAMHNALLDHLEWMVYYSVSTVIRVLEFVEKGHTWMEVESLHSAIESKLKGRQIFWTAEYIDVITAARREHLYKVKQVDHSFFSQLNVSAAFVQAVVLEILKLWTYGVCNTSRMVRWTARSTTVTSGDPTTKTEKEQSWWQYDHQMYKAPMRIMSTKWYHLQQLKKVLPKDYHHFMMHCLMETGDWTQERGQFLFQGRHPCTSNEHAQQSKD